MPPETDDDTAPAATPAPSPPPAPPSPPAPPGDWGNDPQRVIATQLALADAMKPIEAAAADLYAVDRQAARDAIADKYAKAVAPGGDLRRKLDAANANFNETAGFMVDALDEWVKKVATGPLHQLLATRAKTKTDLDAGLGARERARGAAQEDAKAWGARFADWSAPADTITKIVASYADQINKLDLEINGGNAPDAAILGFWFEVAPKHLSGFRRNAVGRRQDCAGQGQERSRPSRLRRSRCLARSGDGTQRRGRLCDPPADLPAKRADVLTKWKDAAVVRAAAEADFKIGPDDAATLKQRWSTLKDDIWIKGAKALLTPAS
jgi:hypothetical protein